MIRALDVGDSLLNGSLYLILSWFGLLALIRSVVNQATIGPIVLVVGLMLMEEALRFLPSRHYAAFLFGLFPSIAGVWVRKTACRQQLHVVGQACFCPEVAGREKKITAASMLLWVHTAYTHPGQGCRVSRPRTP